MVGTTIFAFILNFCFKQFHILIKEVPLWIILLQVKALQTPDVYSAKGTARLIVPLSVGHNAPCAEQNVRIFVFSAYFNCVLRRDVHYGLSCKRHE